MTASWKVHLSPEAAAALRDASPAAAARLAQALDDLARYGPAVVQIDQDGPEWTGRLIAGDYALVVAGRDGDARIVVVCIGLIDEQGAHGAVDLGPLKLPTRRTLVGLLEGLELNLRYTFRALSRGLLLGHTLTGASGQRTMREGAPGEGERVQ